MKLCSDVRIEKKEFSRLNHVVVAAELDHFDFFIEVLRVNTPIQFNGLVKKFILVCLQRIQTGNFELSQAENSFVLVRKREFELFGIRICYCTVNYVSVFIKKEPKKIVVVVFKDQVVVQIIANIMVQRGCCKLVKLAASQQSRVKFLKRNFFSTAVRIGKFVELIQMIIAIETGCYV